jgi:hypothetical protein
MGLFIGLAMSWAVSVHAATYSEDAVKAAFLHRFAAYVQWPAASELGPFLIGVEGAEEVASQLEQLLPGIAIQNRQAQVRRVHSKEDLAGLSIFYVGPGTRSQTRALIEAARTQPILLVMDSPDGLARGAIINFVRVERTVRFEVSLISAERSGLKVTSGLLSVAARIEGRQQTGLGCPAPGYGSQRCAGQLLFAWHAPPAPFFVRATAEYRYHN